MKNEKLSQLIDTILADCHYRENPYFKSLTDGSFSKDDFVETQIQFFWAVVFFSRPMAALAAKIPTPDLRIEIVRNVWEEHGEGNLSKIHGTTFVELLSRLAKITPEEVEKRTLWPEIRAFNTVLSGACVLDEYLTGVGMMGMIERMFADISAWIGRGIVARGWLSTEQMIHYSLHEKLDIKHSDDFFSILEKSWNQSAQDQYAIEQGLRLGAYIFNNLYEGLYRARARRSIRLTRGMHSRAEG
jgi:pyrroloquinoline-quinone synthase